MVSTFTPNTHIELQGTGDNSGTWGSVLNTGALTIIDQVFGGVQTLSLASTDVTVSTSQSQHNAFLLTGVLTADVAVIFPSIGRTVFVVNNTTGSHAVTLKTASAGVTKIIPQGTGGFYVLNVTDVLEPTPVSPGFGTLTDIAGGTTIDLGTITTLSANVTGSAWNCTSFGSSASLSSPIYFVKFAAAGTLVYNATSMILPNAINKSVAAGDTAFALYLGSGNWQVIYNALNPSGYRYLGTQTFSVSGTYTASAGVRFVRITARGGGGGGGSGSSSTSASSAAGGGGEGGLSVFIGALPSATMTVTIGAGGTVSANATGGTGGDTSVGSSCIAKGGVGGVGGASHQPFQTRAGGLGGAASSGTGTIKYDGAPGLGGISVGASPNYTGLGGTGGGAGAGRGGATASGGGNSAGSNALGNGGGGGGAVTLSSDSGNSSGGTGAAGFVTIDEYV